MGKAKDPHTQVEEHQSRPLASLKDPEAFGPPPKNVNHCGGAAVPNAITPDRLGLGAPLSSEEVRATQEGEENARRAAAEATPKPAPSPVPYRVDRTGLSTSNLPKPPVRRIDYAEQASPVSASPMRKPKPALPPRLPPRQATPTLDLSEPSSPPPMYTSATQQQPTGVGHLNQGALKRLGSAGVSVPGLDIGGQPQASASKQDRAGNPARDSVYGPVGGQKPTLNELHSRFSGLPTKSSTPETPSQGTSFTQKQAALKTASSFRNDPSSVSLSDAKATAATANNFRERHGDQVAAGWKSANAFNNKYDVAGKAGGLAGNPAVEGRKAMPWSDSRTSESPSIMENKNPPPPPPRRVNVGNPPGASPPPIPLASKPKT